MKKLTRYLKTHRKYKLYIIKKVFLTQEIRGILYKYNLNLHELCYRIRNNIPLNKIFTCKNCGKKTQLSVRGYKKFCNRFCTMSFINKSLESTEKRKQTSLKKYGVSWYTQTTALKDFNKKHNKEIRHKMKETLIKKYGVDNYSKTIECQEKVYNTKKKNNTHTKSGQEEQVYQLLLTKFSKEDIIRQYKSKLYPYQCDFYIKSLDLYIEYNGHWTHGWDSCKLYGVFNKDNDNHLKLLNKWKSKSSELNFKKSKKDQYKKAIYVWTILDPLKLKTAKDNKLNYKIFWTVKEVEDWIKNTSRL